MTFIPENFILESISTVIDDYILPMGGFYRTITAIAPETASPKASGITNTKWGLKYNNLVYMNPSHGDTDLYALLSRRLARLRAQDNFNPDNLITPVQVIAPNTGYVKVDYKNGVLTKSGTVTDPLKVAYSYKVAKVITSWPAKPEDIELPSISINSSQYYGSQWALGTEANNNKFMYFIEVWAGSNTQRSYICSLIEQSLRVDIPLLNFDEGYQLTGGGEINPSFNPVTQRIRLIRIESVKFTYLPPPSGDVSEKEKARASGVLNVSLIL